MQRTIAVLQQIKMVNPTRFEKVFGEFDSRQVAEVMHGLIGGLSDDALARGLARMNDSGYFPDPLVFKNWCLGKSAFSDPIADSYAGEYAALANITAWVSSGGRTPISVAEKAAYDASYTLWQRISNEFSQSTADRAFRENYSAIVKEAIARGEKSAVYVAPVAIRYDENAKDKFTGGVPISTKDFERLFAKLQADISAKKQARAAMRSL